MVIERATVWANVKLLLSAQAHKAFHRTLVIPVSTQLNSGAGAIANINEAKEGGIYNTRPDRIQD